MQIVAPRAFSAAAQKAEQPGNEAATAKQGWGQTRILDILKSKVGQQCCTHLLSY